MLMYKCKRIQITSKYYRLNLLSLPQEPLRKKSSEHLCNSIICDTGERTATEILNYHNEGSRAINMKVSRMLILSLMLLLTGKEAREESGLLYTLFVIIEYKFTRSIVQYDDCYSIA